MINYEPYFHRITRLSAAYNEQKNDRQYTYSLKSGRRGNSLGTVYHLAKDAGVDLKNEGWKKEWNDYKSSAVLPSAPSHLTRVRDCKNNSEIPSLLQFNFPKRTNDTDNEEETIENVARLNLPPAFKAYDWPRFLMRCLNCCENDSQKDALWISCLAILGATTAPLLRFYYSHKIYHPNLIIFIVAPSASGKGVITWAYKLGEPLQQLHRVAFKKLMEEYKKQYNAWSCLGKQKGSVQELISPSTCFD